MAMTMTMTMAMAQRVEAMSINDVLPPEIWHQILTKLPAKSILRCRSVSKTWYSLISSPDFITDHSAQTLNHSTTNRVLFLRRDRSKNLDKFSSHDESFVESHEHDDLPGQLRIEVDLIVGSCNGLVCLLVEDELTEENDDIQVHSFLIWNPSIRKLVEIPFRPSRPEPNDVDDLRYLLGFGFDSDSGDYKVLRVGYLPSYEGFVPVVSQIFDLRKGVWRGISPPLAPRNMRNPATSVYFRGSLHWIAYEDWSNYALVSFNLSSEVSQKMGMPDGVVFKDNFDWFSVVANNGLLSLSLLRSQLQGYVVQYHCTVWSMKEYGVTESWTKLFNIELPYSLNCLGLVRFWENGEVVIAGYESDNVLIVYNPQNRTSKALLSADQYVFDEVCFYKESLVLL